jgi:transcriptional regulator with XRE-family HTH domain
LTKKTNTTKTSLLAQFLTRRIAEIAHTKSVDEIAQEIGYEKAKMILRFASGEAITPIEKLPALAKALDVELALLFRLAIRDYFPSAADALEEVIVQPTVRTPAASSDAGRHEEGAGAKAAGPGLTDTAEEGPASSFVDLNFKVSPAFHKRFRVEAAFAELSLKDLMIASFESWLKHSARSGDRS